ncbi:hypothetical protein GCM10022250_41890 [Flavobacterium chungbukense]|uniref:Uncharacterized protein n=1 Tax=Flavobacterium chungbukense TaxID=877464 RepID=A0ABP7YT75_9FLAO
MGLFYEFLEVISFRISFKELEKIMINETIEKGITIKAEKPCFVNKKITAIIRIIFSAIKE